MRLGVAGWRGNQRRPRGLQQLGNWQAAFKGSPSFCPAINDCPEASPSFFVHHLCSVTAGKDLEAPQSSNSFSSSSSCCYSKHWPLMYSP